MAMTHDELAQYLKNNYLYYVYSEEDGVFISPQKSNVYTISIYLEKGGTILHVVADYKCDFFEYTGITDQEPNTVELLKYMLQENETYSSGYWCLTKEHSRIQFRQTLYLGETKMTSISPIIDMIAAISSEEQRDRLHKIWLLLNPDNGKVDDTKSFFASAIKAQKQYSQETEDMLDYLIGLQEED